MPPALRFIIFMFCTLLFAVSTNAQVVRVYGKVTNNKFEALPNASIHLRTSSVGTLSKEDGSYELFISKGTYEIIVSMLGYKTRILPMVVNEETLQNIILEDDEEKSTLSEVVIKVKLKDRADEIMKKLVDNKENINKSVKNYSYKAYIKATLKDSALARNEDVTQTTQEPAVKTISEILLKVDKDESNRIKEERLGVKVSGENKKLFYQTTTDGNFDFYDNLIYVPSISPTPFVSPVSNTGLLSYKFKTVSIERRGREKLYTISVKPKALTNATVEGEITVSDSTWSILYCRFRFPDYHLQEYSFFEVEQQHDFIDGKAWLLNQQKFTYYADGKHNRISGQTIVNYSDYELNRQFSRRHFSNEVSVTTQNAYQRDSAFWRMARRETLSTKEAEFIHYRDSLFAVTQTRAYQDSIDREINRITWKKIGFFGQTLYNRDKQRSWYLPPLVSLYSPFAFGGGRLNASIGYGKFFPNRKNLFVNASLSYGLRNKDINGSIDLSRKYNTFSQGYYTITAKREFQFIYEGDAYINMIKRSNIYLNNELGVGHGLELFNGLFLRNELGIALRRSVSNYKTGSLVDSLLGDVLNNNQPVPFQPYNALYGKVRLEYTPFQRYRREPLEKIILGSKWPTVYVEWRKGIKNILASDVDFDYLEFGLQQTVNLGLLGQTKYTVSTGSFLSQKDLRLIDFKFQRRGDPFLFMNPHRSFQALDSTFPIFKRFYEGHFVHEFNGFLLNKIPLLKKLKLREIAGTGFLFTQERNLRYAELFAGIERAFQSPFNPLDKFKIGVYVVGSTANQFSNPIQFKLGFTTWDKRRGKWF
ncbi:MAG: carboxypeptidase-like regulatory domain-containing protein [Chitinophagaceae bacterium]|nr:MAG: carboxypeptidase-like regulatory domain-containing protein [Chitinophagaceae bacterium]